MKRLSDAWRVVRGWMLYAMLLDCEHCQGTALERWDGAWQPCSMCKGSGSQRHADQAALNAPLRCGCPECSGEWDQ
jgi:DnaJ-class molecular chaperone